MWWFGYIVFLILGISVIFYIHRFKDKQTEMIALILTIFSIFLTFSDEFCSQYDYESGKIVKAIWDDISNNNEVSITDLIGNDINCPQFFFVLDVSQSTKTTSIPIDNNKRNELNCLIEEINNSGFISDIQSLNSNQQSVPLSELLRFQLYSVLLDMTNSKSKFSIISFAKNPEFLTIDCTFTDENLMKTFSLIKNIEFNGMETDFKTLFDFIEKKVKNTDNPFKRDKNTLILLSDFVNDCKKSNNNHDSIINILNRLGKKSIHFNMIGISNISKPANFMSISEMIEDVLPERYKTIDAFNELTINLELSNHKCKNPLHFYSKNRLHEDNIKTVLSFANTSNKCYRFRLVNNSNTRQFYQLVYGTDTTKFTDAYPIKIKLTSDNKISILMDGHIGSEQFTPNILIEDLTDKYSISIGIIFYKELSKSSKILGSVLLGMCISFVIIYGRKICKQLIKYLKKPTTISLIKKS